MKRYFSQEDFLHDNTKLFSEKLQKLPALVHSNHKITYLNERMNLLIVHH